MRRKGIEIKKIGNSFYAYEVTTVWDRNEKKRKKVSKYLGKWVQGKIEGKKSPHPKNVYELGNISLLWVALRESGLARLLQMFFPDYYNEIVLLSFSKIANPQSLKNLKTWYEKTYLAKMLKTSVSLESLLEFLREIGMQENVQRDFFRKFGGKKEQLVCEVPISFWASKDTNPLELDQEYLLPHFHLLLAFSKAEKQPCCFRLVPGSSMDIKAFWRFAEEIRDKNAIFILDKSFLDKHSLDSLEGATFNFILPLRRSNGIVDYEKRIPGWFLFKERIVGYTSYSYDSFRIYLFEDVSLRRTEENEFYNLGFKSSFTAFSKKWMGKIILLSNMEIKPWEAFSLYMFRNETEKNFRSFFQTDISCLKDEASVQGYVFVMFISFLLYHYLLEKFAEVKLKEMSVEEVLLELSKVCVVEIEKQREIVSEIPEKIRKIADLLGLKLDLFPDISRLQTR